MASAAQAVLLAQKYDDSINPEGWWMSEKLDGVRAYWSGHKFYSRNGNEFIAPKFFTKDLPTTPLDGELWCGRGMFSKALSVVKKTKNPEKFEDDWKYLTYLVFDAPSHGGTYEERVKYLKETINASKQTTYAAVVGISKCKGRAHLKETLKEVLKKGGEGVMLRKAGSRYENKRSHTLLKVKYFHDEEAKVTGRLPGTGRCSDMMGKVECVLPNGCTFKVGSGFTDAQRKNKKFCRIGSVITFKYQELSSHGNPRFPVFLRERPDLTWDDVVANAKTKPPFSSMKQRVGKLTKQHSILFSTVPSRDQRTGKKIVTDADSDDKAGDDDDDLIAGGASASGSGSGGAAGDSDADDDGSATAPAKKAAGGKRKGGKRQCKYGANCFRVNAQHLADFEHPPRAGDVDHDLAAGDADLDTGDSKAPASRSNSASTATAAAGTARDDDDGDEERPADEEADAKKSKAELDAEIDEVSRGVGSAKAAASAAAAAVGKKRAAVDLPPITNGKDANCFKRKRTPGTADVAGAKPAAAAATATATAKPKVACFYGAKCYQTNPNHLARFSHPSSDDDAATAEDQEVDALREAAAAAKLEARVVRRDSEEAREIDRKLSEYFDFGLASDDDDDHPRATAAPTATAAAPSKPKPKASTRSAAAAATGGAAASAAAASKSSDDDDGSRGGAGGSWGIASDGDDDEKVTLVVSKKEWEKFQKMTAVVSEVANSVTARPAVAASSSAATGAAAGAGRAGSKSKLKK